MVGRDAAGSDLYARSERSPEPERFYRVSLRAQRTRCEKPVADTMRDTKGFQGRAVAAFESRLAAEMVRLIERHGGRPFVAASMREVPIDDNREAVAFGDDLLRGRFDLIVFL